MPRTEPCKRDSYLKSPDLATRTMALPVGKTCGGCYAFPHCQAIYAHIAADEVCDFYPNRFAARTELNTIKTKPTSTLDEPLGPGEVRVTFGPGGPHAG
jgi:hypothetical protein